MSQFEPGKLINLSLKVHRVVAPNAGMMTGPGTNTYLVGNDDIAVIDPGPDDPQHIKAITDAAKALNGTIRWILCTHTHPDHSPGSKTLAAETGAKQFGQLAPEGPSQDQTFKPDHQWQNGETVPTDTFRLKAIYTPGHASNHWCYLLEDEHMLFTGDHIMNGSTVVIAPPDGNMKHYLDSLESLKSETLTHIAPGHGDLIDNPLEVIEGTIQHRLMREDKTMEKLQALSPATLDDLVKEVYDEVPIFLHALAKYSLTAHLDKLEAEGRVTQNNDIWTVATQ